MELGKVEKWYYHAQFYFSREGMRKLHANRRRRRKLTDEVNSNGYREEQHERTPAISQK